MRPELLNPLFAEVTALKGIGATLAKPMERLGMARVVDVAFHLPRFARVVAPGRCDGRAAKPLVHLFYQLGRQFRVVGEHELVDEIRCAAPLDHMHVDVCRDGGVRIVRGADRVEGVATLRVAHNPAAQRAMMIRRSAARRGGDAIDAVCIGLVGIHDHAFARLAVRAKHPPAHDERFARFAGRCDSRVRGEFARQAFIRAVAV